MLFVIAHVFARTRISQWAGEYILNREREGENPTHRQLEQLRYLGRSMSLYASSASAAVNRSFRRKPDHQQYYPGIGSGGLLGLFQIAAIH